MESSPVTIVVADSGSKFKGLGAYGSQTGTIVADGKSGVFYLNTTAIPSFYRTGNYGGRWAPVTLSTDDSIYGIDGQFVVGSPATSGFPGEIAAIGGGKVWYSQDFGVTWRNVDLPMVGNPLLLWGHAGNASVLFLFGRDTTDMCYTAMPTDANPNLVPSWTVVANSFKQDPGDKLAIANGTTAPILAVAAAVGGAVTLYEIPSTTVDRLAASKATLSGFPAGLPTFVRLGGRQTGQTLGSGHTPNTVRVYVHAPGSSSAAVMSTYSAGAWTTTATTVFKQ